MALIGKNVDMAAQLLLRGKLVAVPTETVYGLAANALNEKAVLAIFEAKQRPFFDPLIIHVHSKEVVPEYAVLADERLKQLAHVFWPGPLTLLLPKQKIIPDIVTSGLNRIAVRVPNHALTHELLVKLNLPLAAPSANPFGYVSPTEPRHVNKQLGHKVDYILDGGPCAVGIESTIAGIEDDQLCIYRHGGLAVEEIEKVVGKAQIRINNSGNPHTPGQLKSHYAPLKPLFVGNLNDLLAMHSGKKIAVICFGNIHLNDVNLLVFNLSSKNDLYEAALNLFSMLRKADDSECDVIVCCNVPNEGLGKAINDRLKRAAC